MICVQSWKSEILRDVMDRPGKHHEANLVSLPIFLIRPRPKTRSVKSKNTMYEDNQFNLCWTNSATHTSCFSVKFKDKIYNTYHIWYIVHVHVCIFKSIFKGISILRLAAEAIDINEKNGKVVISCLKCFYSYFICKVSEVRRLGSIIIVHK